MTKSSLLAPEMQLDSDTHISDHASIDLSIYRRPYGGFATSPFRYPGGKGFLTPFLADEIRSRFPEDVPDYAEPYCGGAGAALNLLAAGHVKRLFLNDADRRIFSAWRAIIFETEKFIDKIQTSKVDLSTWEACLHRLHEQMQSEYDFDTGFSAFFINRTSRSGVLIGSGPIGGYNQEGKWKIDARFNKETLIQRIRTLGELRDRINLSCDDGLNFCLNLQSKTDIEKTFLFIDPPYVGAGGRLYFDGMNELKHKRLAEWLISKSAPHWLLTYDDHPIVRENYESMQKYKVQVKYSLSKKRNENELLYKS